jgi:repressor LexA
MTNWRNQTLAALLGFEKVHGYPPTLRDLMELTGASSTSVVSYRLQRLEADGLVKRSPRLARAIQAVVE